MLVDEIDQRSCNSRSVALCNNPNSLVSCFLRLNQSFLSNRLAVKGHDFDLLTIQSAAGVDMLSEKLKVLQSYFPE